MPLYDQYPCDDLTISSIENFGNTKSVADGVFEIVG